MKVLRLGLVFVATLVISCSEEHDAEEPRTARENVEAEDENKQPHEDKIAEDCVAFLRATKVTGPPVASAACPGCPAEVGEVLTFREMKIDGISCANDTCDVMVTIRASFNPALGGTVAGGLTAWISPEQRDEYLRGRTPSAEQDFPVKITYKRRSESWRPVEFDRPGGE
jgi:hypothetical protein